MLQQLKPEYAQKVLHDQVLAAKIGQMLGKHMMSVQRWARKNSLTLSLPVVVEVIRKHEGLSEDAELLEDRKPDDLSAAA